MRDSRCLARKKNNSAIGSDFTDARSRFDAVQSRHHDVAQDDVRLPVHDLLEKARREGHDFQILAKPVKPEKLISIILAEPGTLL